MLEIVFAAIWLAAFGLYFMPSIVAGRKRHKDQWPIFWLNLLTGWTGLGWLGAILWAISGVDARPQSDPAQAANAAPGRTAAGA